MENGHGHSQRAGAFCVVNYDSKCRYCKLKVLEIMRSVRGDNYDVIIDAVKGIVSINAEVDPNIFVSAINMESGYHGELVQARITKVDNKSHEVNVGCTHNNHHHYNHHHNSHALLEAGGGMCHALPAAAGGFPSGDGVVIYPNGYENYRRPDAAVVYPSGFENHPRGCTNSCCRPTPDAVWVPSYPPQQGPYYPDQYQQGPYYPDQYGSGINCSIM